MARRRPPIGVILAGGSGRRMGGSKAVVKLGGKPLIQYPLETMRLALDDVAVIAKADTLLPTLPGVTIWIEPPAPQHPLVGITHALALAGRRPILVCAGDLPFVSAELIDRLAHADPAGAPAVVASLEHEMQPLLGCYQQAASKPLAPLAAAADTPLREAVAAIGPRLFEVADADELFNVNAPDDLLMASAMLDRRKRVSQT